MATTKKRQPIKKNTITPDMVDKFFALLALTYNVVASSKAAKITRSYVYTMRRTDEEFARRWAEAEATAHDKMEGEAYRRAVYGVVKPVYQGGKKVGTVREYSDPLMVILLKANRGEKYKDKSSVDVNHGGKVDHNVNLSPRSEELLSKLTGVTNDPA